MEHIGAAEWILPAAGGRVSLIHGIFRITTGK